MSNDLFLKYRILITIFSDFMRENSKKSKKLLQLKVKFFLEFGKKLSNLLRVNFTRHANVFISWIFSNPKIISLKFTDLPAGNGKDTS